ncbi:thioredoxin domain-containing protein [Microtetraspora sp. NBRC 16547]|uniref:DsbA family protein n=1 Tax=Microtetraspora sp. NBRC 16547 TaxID=3030993 RepID=UPI0024A4ED7E|nr:thioredoxin domain-containing protein [Microtetraspora sp. NBRC 16547]GLW98569.1 hypothetical protein Misp02_26560 [Microtetraspora sp. NBRC 16547]
MGTNNQKNTVKRDAVLVVVLLVVAVGLLGSLVTRPSNDATAAGRGGPGTSAASPGGSDGTAGSGTDADGASPSGTSADETGPLSSVARRVSGDPLAVGRPDAPVTMVVYSDFRCPFCAKFGRDIEPELVKRYAGKGTLRIEWRDYPIFGEPSINVARAARAAGAQGKFREFSAALYAAAPATGHPDYTSKALRKFAEQAGVPDLDRFVKDMGSKAFDEAIEKDMIEGQSIGVPSTPAFLINGQPLLGAQPLEEFTAMIDQAAGHG